MGKVNMNVVDALKRRRSTRHFEPGALLLPREAIEDLIADACLSPTEFNLQPWRFIVIRDQEKKEILYDCTWKQEKVREASAVVIVLGDLRAGDSARELLDRAVKEGRITPADARRESEMMAHAFANGERSRLLHAIRSPCFAAMSLMLLATERGIATCPIVGFSDSALRAAYHIPDRYVPVIMIALGMNSLTQPMQSRAPRRTTNEIVYHEDMISADA
jgi:putative NAD(P)H nitroreductase